MTERCFCGIGYAFRSGVCIRNNDKVCFGETCQSLCATNEVYNPSTGLCDCPPPFKVLNGVCTPPTPCPAGTEPRRRLGRFFCFSCPPGMYNPLENGHCMPCPTGWYASQGGSASCVLCPHVEEFSHIYHPPEKRQTCPCIWPFRFDVESKTCV